MTVFPSYSSAFFSCVDIYAYYSESDSGKPGTGADWSANRLIN
jgi:hypothetical protein